MAVEAGIHVPVPSVSGEAVLTLPVLVPLSDLIGLSRQVTVLAYQYWRGAVRARYFRRTAPSWPCSRPPASATMTGSRPSPS
jgi:hypothetical protein